MYMLGAKEVFHIGDQPDGYNINDGVGATHMDAVSQLVTDNELDAGVGFDGDMDRALVVDRFGRIIDGDAMAYLGSLTRLHNHIAVSIMANEGVVRAIRLQGKDVTRTPVGDRYLLQARADFKGSKSPVTLGAEQSGHVIYNNEPSGDGMLTFANTIAYSRRQKMPLDTLHDRVQELQFPQRLVSPRVINKEQAMSHPEILACVRDIDSRITSVGGRIVFRASGTGNEIRLLVETPKGTNGLVDEVTSEFRQAVDRSGLMVKAK